MIQAVVTDILPGGILGAHRLDRIHFEGWREDGVGFEGSFAVNSRRHDVVVGTFLQFPYSSRRGFGLPRDIEFSTEDAYRAALRNAIITDPEVFADYVAAVDSDTGVIFWRAQAPEGGVTWPAWGVDSNGSGRPDPIFNSSPGFPSSRTDHPAHVPGTGQTVMPANTSAPPRYERDVANLFPPGYDPGDDN
jgi:hypothetical protein